MQNIDIGDPQLAAAESVQRMQTVIREMREIPELPSEVPKDIQGIDKVEFPLSGGVLTYMKGNEHPYRGFPFYEFVEKVDSIKKLSRGILSGLYGELKTVNKIWLITLLPALWFFKPLVYAGIYSFWRLIVRSRVKTTRYSEAVQEIHRGFDYDDFTENGKTRQIRQWVKDIVCMILEFDNAYRFRFQDAIEELDKENLQKNPLGEIEKILTSMQSRELGQDIKDTWTLLKMFCRLYLRFDKRLLRIIVSSLLRIDIGKIKLSDDDKFYCPFRKDFQPRFMKGLLETKIKKLSKEQKKDRFVIEKAILSKNLQDEKTKLIDKFNTEAAKLKEEYQKKKNGLQAELDKTRNALLEFEKELNNEATRIAAATNNLIHRTKDMPGFEATKKSLNVLVNEDVAALQARYNAEAEKQNKVIQEKIIELAAWETECKKRSDVLEKKYNALLERNKKAYPKKAAKLKKLCQ